MPDIAQLSLTIYETLRDDWDYMGGNYIGKSLLNIFQVFALYDLPKEDHMLVYKIINIIDNERRTIIRAKAK